MEKPALKTVNHTKENDNLRVLCFFSSNLAVFIFPEPFKTLSREFNTKVDIRYKFRNEKRAKTINYNKKIYLKYLCIRPEAATPHVRVE